MNKTQIAKIWLDENAIWLQLLDGRKAYERFEDYSRLASCTPSARENYRLSHFGIHWPELDEDLSYEGFFQKK